MSTPLSSQTVGILPQRETHLPAGPVVTAPAQLVAGLLFGWLRMRTGRVWPGVLAHGLSNAILVGFHPAA